eukprot:1332779-Amorphochlora_amoeboformis.AAC.2
MNGYMRRMSHGLDSSSDSGHSVTERSNPKPISQPPSPTIDCYTYTSVSPSNFSLPVSHTSILWFKSARGGLKKGHVPRKMEMVDCGVTRSDRRISVGLYSEKIINNN